VRRFDGRPDCDAFPLLASAPLFRAVERNKRWASEMETVKALGIADKTLRAWRIQERETVQFDTADKILCGLGLHFWDVWNEQTTRKWALTVRVYRPPNKWSPDKRAKRPRGRESVRAYFYGDLGPDLEAIARAELAFTGEGSGEQLELAAA
jgi:hypothetical protein